MIEVEEELSKTRQVFQWIDVQPSWKSAADWAYFIPDPKRPCIRRLRLNLIGGGQILISENFVSDDPELGGVICLRPKLRVEAETAVGWRVCNGVILGAPCEMDAYAVVFPAGTPKRSQIARPRPCGLSTARRTTSMRCSRALSVVPAAGTR